MASSSVARLISSTYPQGAIAEAHDLHHPAMSEVVRSMRGFQALFGLSDPASGEVLTASVWRSLSDIQVSRTDLELQLMVTRIERLRAARAVPRIDDVLDLCLIADDVQSTPHAAGYATLARTSSSADAFARAPDVGHTLTHDSALRDGNLGHLVTANAVDCELVTLTFWRTAAAATAWADELRQRPVLPEWSPPHPRIFDGRIHTLPLPSRR